MPGGKQEYIAVEEDDYMQPDNVAQQEWHLLPSTEAYDSDSFTSDHTYESVDHIRRDRNWNHNASTSEVCEVITSHT